MELLDNFDMQDDNGFRFYEFKNDSFKSVQRKSLNWNEWIQTNTIWKELR